MKNKIFPIILLIWPYIFLLSAIIPSDTMPFLYNNFITIYSGATILVYGLNIWNAFQCNEQSNVREYAFWNMFLKVVHIPFYIAVFVIGASFLLAMAVPALTFVSPFIVMIFAVIDYMLMITTSSYGIRAILTLTKRGELSKKAAILYVILHFVFVLDIVGAIMLCRKLKSMVQ